MISQLAEPAIQPASLDLQQLNQRFEKASPHHILAWCLDWCAQSPAAENSPRKNPRLKPPTNLAQVSAFGVDDMLLTDLLYRQLGGEVPVVFLETLFHFPETLNLVAAAREFYSLNLQVYGPLGASSRRLFEAKFGDALWEQDLAQFHHITKVEPLQRGLAELGAIAWITARRRDQAPCCANLPIFELDAQQRLKVNPLANWTRKETWAYVFEHDVLYNPLHDQGYPTIGDAPLTMPVSPGQPEQLGCWQGMDQLSCGIHL
jgi:phosphoadenosine phosphosulfate reductase